MGFSVVQGSPQTIWVPVEPAEVIYTGALVGVDIATPLEGIQPLPVAAGASNTTNKDQVLGVVVGNNNERDNLEYSTSYNSDYITQVAAGSVYQSTTQYRGVEGEFIKGDPQAMVEVAVVDPCTILRGPIFDGALGTILSEVTVSTASGGDGIGCTTDAATVATVANWSTIHARSGANKGVYRTLTSASTTAHTWLKAMKADMAIGDKAIVLNGLRPYGPSRMQIDSEAVYVDANAALTADYFIIHVMRLHLSEPGNEYVEFRFDGDNFSAARA